MKAKYKHYGNDCVIYNQIICEDNIVVAVETYDGWMIAEPRVKTTVCKDEHAAKGYYQTLCSRLERSKYECEYKD